MQKVFVEDLQIGMFVEELDISWLDTPYLIQGIMMQSPEDIDEIAKYCEYVYVSLEKSNSVDFEKGAFVRNFSVEEEQYFGNTLYPDLGTVEEELQQARQAERLAEELIKELTSSFQSSTKVELTVARNIVNSLTDSMIRNPDAIILLRQLKTGQKSHYERAINIAVYLIAFGRHLCLPKNELSELGMGGLFMDIGLLRDPEGRRQNPEHVIAAKEILNDYPTLSPRIHDIVLQHHEHEDGSGFPEGLNGSELSPYGRMAGIVDSYDFLVNGMDEVQPLADNPHEAFGILKDWSRGWLNGTLVQQFTCCMGLYPPGCLVELGTGEIGIVLSHSRTQRFMPCLMIIRDASNSPCDPPYTLDLRKDFDEARLHLITRQLDYKECQINPEEYFIL